MFDIPTATGQHIVILLCINVGICICTLVGIFISIKDIIKKHMCKSKMKKTFRKPIFKRRKPPKQKKLPSASEIELNRVNAISSDNDYDSIFDASEF